ncbi:MAG TPA: HAD family hydrolase [Clostridiales bacterium]|nr:HAD family hydrolase [Clostridiales bacterium]
MIDSIIFDMDGTLWDSTQEVAVAFNKVLQEKYPEVTDEVTAERLQGLFGLPLDVIGVRLFQSVNEEKAVKLIAECCEYENEYLAGHGARLYEGLEEALSLLSREYRLFIVSNCQEGYIQCFFKANPHLEKYFTDYEYPGRSGKLKADNIKMVVERNGLKNPIYVGDTAGDAQAAKEAGVPFVFARYGFGEVRDYDDVVDSLQELVEKVSASRLAWEV